MYNVVNSWVAFFALSCHNYKKPPHSPTPHAPINRQSNPTLLTVISTPLLPSILGFSASPSLFISSFLPPFIHNLLLYNTIQLDSNFNFQFNFCYQKPTLDFFSFFFVSCANMACSATAQIIQPLSINSARSVENSDACTKILNPPTFLGSTRRINTKLFSVNNPISPLARRSTTVFAVSSDVVKEKKLKSNSSLTNLVFNFPFLFLLM